MRIILEPTNESDLPPQCRHSRVIIETNFDDYTLPDAYTDIIKPALLAWGYHPQSIESFFEGLSYDSK